jgi:hypothetical protein
MIYPDLIKLRSELLLMVNQLLNSTPKPTEKEMLSEIESILVMSDGDFPQIEVITGKLLIYCQTNKIEVMKHAAGCSLWQQAMDLSKGFWNWRMSMSAPPSNFVNDRQLPPHCQLIQKC